MKLKDYAPPEVLLSIDAIKNIANEYSKANELKSKHGKDLELIITLAINLLLNILAFAPNFSNLDLWAQVIASIIMLAIFVYLVIGIVRWRKNSSKIKEDHNINLSIDTMLINKAKENLRYTAIIRVVDNEKNKTLYLTGDDFFLPHGSLDKYKEISEQDKIVRRCLVDLGVSDKDILSVIPVDGEVHFSIKPVHGDLSMNAFVFYDVRIKIQSRDKLLQQNTKGKWMTLEDMKKKPGALATNKDVIALLEDLPHPLSSFVNTRGNVKVIWNITSKCHYNCEICATHDKSRVELSANDKLTVLNNLCKAKNLINSVDFAGGDPLVCNESVNIIQAAIEQLGEDRVSISTTGIGAAEYMKNKFPTAIKHCEITIDASKAEGDNPDFTRNEAEYSNSNIEQVNALLDYTEALTINVPIINDDLSDEDIECVINKIVNIKERHRDIEIDATLLRLMPVGKLGSNTNKTKYAAYNPIDVVNKLKNGLESNGIKCKLHCSLRCIPAFNDGKACCNMFESKVGIDCAGNVFACAWGGYVTDRITENPFYLGNLTKVSLSDILEGRVKSRQYTDMTAEINSRNRRKFCSVVSYFQGGNAFKNYDPLSAENGSNNIIS
ncbi:MAG: hypothetical protein J1F39_03055 [Clostridiales bacterium]|nr:hypothetical protein [Clostridiales bacterium]